MKLFQQMDYWIIWWCSPGTFFEPESALVLDNPRIANDKKDDIYVFGMPFPYHHGRHVDFLSGACSAWILTKDHVMQLMILTFVKHPITVSRWLNLEVWLIIYNRRSDTFSSSELQTSMGDV